MKRLEIPCPNINSSVVGRNGYHTELKGLEVLDWQISVTLGFIGKSGKTLHASFYTDRETMDRLCETWMNYRQGIKIEEEGK